VSSDQRSKSTHSLTFLEHPPLEGSDDVALVRVAGPGGAVMVPAGLLATSRRGRE
jgi:hypothetical protein